MGGPIASLLAREHPDLIRGLVLCATAPDWSNPRMKRLVASMGVTRATLGVFPNAAWRGGLRAAGFPDSPVTTWYAAELTRGSAKDIAEAGRELGRYDGRPWLPTVKVPAAVVVTVEDKAVPRPSSASWPNSWARPRSTRPATTERSWPRPTRSRSACSRRSTTSVRATASAWRRDSTYVRGG